MNRAIDRRRAGWLTICLALGLVPSAASAVTVEGEHAGLDLLTHARTYTLLLFDPGADARRQAVLDLGLDPAAVPGTDAERAAVVERFRIVLEAWAGDAWSASVHYDLIPTFGQASGEGLVTTAQNPLRRWDLDPTLHTSSGGDWTLGHGLDRAVLRWQHPRLQIRIGRQAVGFGGARIFDAADLFAPLGPASIDSAFKAGVDGVRLIAPIGEHHAVGLLATVHRDDWRDGVLLARWKGVFDGFDAAVIGGASYGEPTAAVALAGDLGGLGWYLDASARIRIDALEDTPLRATVGVDHYWLSGIRLVGELHYNGVGVATPAGYLALRDAPAHGRGEVFLLGELYAGGLAVFEVHPLVAVNLSWMQSLTDGSALIGPTIGWDFAEDVTLGAGALLPIGERMSLGPGLQTDVGGEFGLYPLVVFTDLRLVL